MGAAVGGPALGGAIGAAGETGEVVLGLFTAGAMVGGTAGTTTGKFAVGKAAGATVGIWAGKLMGARVGDGTNGAWMGGGIRAEGATSRREVDCPPTSATAQIGGGSYSVCSQVQL
jgi:hypothetical protein